MQYRVAQRGDQSRRAGCGAQCGDRHDTEVSRDQSPQPVTVALEARIGRRRLALHLPPPLIAAGKPPSDEMADVATVFLELNMSDRLRQSQ